MKFSQTVHIVRTIQPAAGKTDMVETCLSALALMVQSFEPGALKYQVFAALDGTIITQEIYSNCETALSHLSSSPLANFLEKCADNHLLQKEIDMQVLQPFMGFESRPKLTEA